MLRAFLASSARASAMARSLLSIGFPLTKDWRVWRAVRRASSADEGSLLPLSAPLAIGARGSQ